MGWMVMISRDQSTNWKIKHLWVNSSWKILSTSCLTRECLQCTDEIQKKNKFPFSSFIKNKMEKTTEFFKFISESHSFRWCYSTDHIYTLLNHFHLMEWNERMNELQLKSNKSRSCPTKHVHDDTFKTSSLLHTNH